MSVPRRAAPTTDMLRVRSESGKGRDGHIGSELDSLINDAARLGDTTAAARAVGMRCNFGESSHSDHVDRHITALIDEHLPRCHDLSVRSRAKAHAALFFSLVDYQRCRRYYLESIDDARAATDDDALAFAHSFAYVVLTHPDDWDHRLDAAYDLLRLGEVLNENAYRFEGLYLLFSCQLQRGDPALRGTLVAAERILEIALATAPVARSRAMTAYMGLVLAVRFSQGRSAEIRPLLIEIAKAQPEFAGRAGALAWAAACEGDWDGVEEQCRRSDDGRNLPHDVAWIGTVYLLGRSVAARGDVARSATIDALLTPHTNRMAWAGHTAIGPVDLAIAELAAVRGDNERAIEHLGHAERFCSRLHAPAFATQLADARTRLTPNATPSR